MKHKINPQFEPLSIYQVNMLLHDLTASRTDNTKNKDDVQMQFLGYTKQVLLQKD